MHCSCIACDLKDAILLQCNPFWRVLSSQVYLKNKTKILLKMSCQIISNSCIHLQYSELLTIDWIMETRLSLWELEYGNFDSDDYYSFVPVDSAIMSNFQDDLNLLRCLTAQIPVRYF